MVVEDHVLAEEICEALKHAGIHHVDFWPRGHPLDPSIGIPEHGVTEPGSNAERRSRRVPFTFACEKRTWPRRSWAPSSSGLQGS